MRVSFWVIDVTICHCGASKHAMMGWLSRTCTGGKHPDRCAREIRVKKKDAPSEACGASVTTPSPSLHTVGWVRTLGCHEDHFSAEGRTWDGTQE
jgi:hypothetical protein